MNRGVRVIDGTLLAMLGLLGVLAFVAHVQGGGELVTKGLGDGGSLLLRYVPIIVISFLAAGYAQALIPEEAVRRLLGHDSGLQGILIATAAGIITPSGPFLSMPVAAVMLRSGAAPGPVVAFLAGWSLLALHRFVAWEIPILGWRFAVLRYGTCVALPVVAGLLARLVTRG